MRKVPADCIFIACHKPCYIPDVSCFYPVRVGAELHKEPIEGMQDDNEGENISSLIANSRRSTGRGRIRTVSITASFITDVSLPLIRYAR